MSDTPTYPQIAERAPAWWLNLQPGEAGGGDRAALARLRRAATPIDAMAEEATLALFHRLGLAHTDRNRLPRVAVIAMVLAHVREDSRGPAATAVGRKTLEDVESARMKPLRFRRLLAARADDELVLVMRRLVALAERRINVGDLAASLFYWGDNVRTRWAFEYFAAGAAAPDHGASAA